ncbi:hypothetical protein ACE6H2_027249 [Prunus campanulata]
MERNGCLPNVVTYNTLIDAYCKLNRIDQAFELLRLMALKGLELNLISYNVVINGLCREGRMNETSQVIFTKHFVLQEEMRRNRLSPNVFNVINAMCKAKNLNRAMEFFDQMRVRGLRPNERTYTKLIDGFSQQGFLNEAYDGLKEMIGNGLSPSIVTYNALINGYCLLGRMEDAIRILQDMTGNGLSPDDRRWIGYLAELVYPHQNFQEPQIYGIFHQSSAIQSSALCSCDSRPSINIYLGPKAPH